MGNNYSHPEEERREQCEDEIEMKRLLEQFEEKKI